MSKGLVSCQCSGRRRVPSAINAEVERLHGPYVRLGPLAHVTGLKPSGSSGAPPGQEVPLERWTRVDTGPLFVLGSPRSRSPARHALLGAPDPLVQGSGVLPRRSGPIDAPWGVLSLLATWCSQPYPCSGAGVFIWDVLSLLATWHPRACPCGGVRRRSPRGKETSHGCGVFML